MDLSTITNEDVLAELFRYMPPDQRAVLCSVAGDPSTVEGKAWGGIPWAKGTRCPLLPSRNNYVAISSFRANTEGRWRRRKDQFAATHAIMVDDIGTKLDVKMLPAGLAPTMVVETSPGNYQVTYMLSEPLYDQGEAEEAVRQMIAQLTEGGVDPGMAGVTRVLRLPGGINGKPKYERDGKVWSCRLAYWRPDIRTRWVDLCRAFGVVHKQKVYAEPDGPVTLERKRGFALVLEGLESLHRVKKKARGWVDIKCPWVLEHSDRADTGSAVAYPAQANGFFGGYRCHHGHCQHRNWADLEDWVATQIIINGRATRRPFEGAPT